METEGITPPFYLLKLCFQRAMGMLHNSLSLGIIMDLDILVKHFGNFVPSETLHIKQEFLIIFKDKDVLRIVWVGPNGKRVFMSVGSH